MKDSFLDTLWNYRDRRGTFAVLTEAGLAMQQQIWVVYADEIADYFACYLQDEEEIKTLQRVLSRLLSAVDQ